MKIIKTVSSHKASSLTSKVSRVSSITLLSAAIAGCFWENNSKTESVEPEYLLQPANASELVEYIGKATKKDRRVRMTGSGLSYSDIAITEDVLFTPEQLNSPLNLDRSKLKNPNDALLARVQSGITVRELNSHLDSKGQAIINLGGYDGQTIGGVMMTATHGSGLNYGPISDQVLSMQVVGEGGRMYQIEPSDGITDPAKFTGRLAEDKDIQLELIQDDDAFNAMRVSIGSMGVVYAVVLKTDQKFWLREVRSLLTWSELKAPGGYLERIVNGLPLKDNGQSPEHYELQYSPYEVDGDYKFLLTERYRSYSPLPEQGPNTRGKLGTNFLSTILTAFEMPVATLVNLIPAIAPTILVSAIDAQEDDNFTNLSYKVFNIGVVNNTDVLAIELAFDLQDAEAAIENSFEVAQTLMDNDGIPHTSPVAIRFVKSTDDMIAMQHGRDSMMMEIIMLKGVHDLRDLLDAHTTSAIDEFDARLHWGLDLKYFNDTDVLSEQYPRWDDWMEQYSQFNTGVFDGRVTDRLGISNNPR